MKRKLLALSLILALFLTSCGGGPTPSKSPAPNSTAPSGTPSESAPPSDSAQPETVTFTDHLDREVTVPQNPQRVAALIGSFAQVWTLAGGEVVATANDAWTSFDLGLDESVVNLGKTTEMSLELLLSADPDFIVASAKTDIDVELMPTFEDMGIPTAYFDVNTFDEYLDMLEKCTQITGRADLYQTNGLDVRVQVDKVLADAAAYKDVHPEVLYLRATGSSVKAKGGKGTVLGQILTDLGCVNIADSDDSLLEDLSIERIVEADPEFIFIVMQGSDQQKVEDKLEAELTGNPAWSGLTAVQSGKLYFMDQKLYNLKPCNRWGEAYEGVARILYGETPA